MLLGVGAADIGNSPQAHSGVPGRPRIDRLDSRAVARLIDLSVPIVPSPATLPDLLRTEIEFADHAAGAAQIRAMFGVGSELLRDGEGWAVETFTRFGTHNSTHVDAPYHYNSTIGGERAETIDELPLDWFYAPGVVLDFHDRADGETIEVSDLEPALAAAGHTLRERDIVLMRTGRDRVSGWSRTT